MRAWAIEFVTAKGTTVFADPLYWTGDGLLFSSDLGRAVCFARSRDVERFLMGEPLLQGKLAEVSLEEPERANSEENDNANSDSLRNPEGH